MITFGGNTDVSIAEFHHGEGDEGTHATLKLLDGAFHAIVANLLDTRRKMDFKVQTPLGVVERSWGGFITRSISLFCRGPVEKGGKEGDLETLVFLLEWWQNTRIPQSNSGKSGA